MLRRIGASAWLNALGWCLIAIVYATLAIKQHLLIDTCWPAPRSARRRAG